MQYNGCKWKGGKLRLEKAKEHYLTRLKREWEQEAAAAQEMPASADVESKKEKLELNKAVLDSTKINIYFPKLRKVSNWSGCEKLFLCSALMLFMHHYVLYSHLVLIPEWV